MALLRRSGQAGRMNRMIELIDVVAADLATCGGGAPDAAAPINTICTNVPGPPVSSTSGEAPGDLVPLARWQGGVGLALRSQLPDTLTIGSRRAASC